MRLSTERRCEVNGCQQTTGLKMRIYQGKPILACTTHQAETEVMPLPQFLLGREDGRAARKEAQRALTDEQAKSAATWHANANRFRGEKWQAYYDGFLAGVQEGSAGHHEAV